MKPGELFLEVTDSGPQVSHLIDEAAVRGCTYIAEKGLGHLVGLHAKTHRWVWEARANAREVSACNAYRVARLAR